MKGQSQFGLLFLLGLLVAGVVVLELFPEAKILFLVIIAVQLWTFVQGVLGPGIVSDAISVILILVFTSYFWVAAPLYLFFTMAGLGLLSPILWFGAGLGKKQQQGGH